MTNDFTISAFLVRQCANKTITIQSVIVTDTQDVPNGESARFTIKGKLLRLAVGAVYDIDARFDEGGNVVTIRSGTAKFRHLLRDTELRTALQFNAALDREHELALKEANRIAKLFTGTENFYQLAKMLRKVPYGRRDTFRSMLYRALDEEARRQEREER